MPGIQLNIANRDGGLESFKVDLSGAKMVMISTNFPQA